MVPVVVWAYIGGPDAGYAGVPGEANCTDCHSGRVNSNGGSVTVTFPNGTTYVPGVKQHLKVTIADPASTQKAWGFQLTARLSGNSRTQAGTFSSTDNFTGVECGNSALTSESDVLSLPNSQVCQANFPLQYIEHNTAGENNSLRKTGSFVYEFDWTPPANNVGSITIYVAGNAGNGDGQTNGDHIYTNSYTLTSGTAVTPSISEVDNAFSSVANSPIQSTSWVAIKGSNLATLAAPYDCLTNDQVSQTLPTSLDGVSVSIGGKSAFMYCVSPGQVNVQAPSGLPTGQQVDVVVTNNNVASPSLKATVQPYSPALLEWLSGGSPHYAEITRATDGAFIGNPSAIQGTNSAKPGDILTLWVTGLGPTSPDFPAGVQTTNTFPALITNPTVTVGGQTAGFIGAILRYAGMYQVNIQLPASLSDGDQVIRLTSAGAQSPDGILINIKH
jgi:uncharacterized protein (TIGR03437 family)